MRIRLLTLAALALSGALAPQGYAQGRRERAVRRELEATYAKVAEAYRNKDIEAFMDDKTADFTARSLGGNVATREQVEAGVKQRMARVIRLNYLKVRLKELTVAGDVAVAITTQEFSRVVADPQGNERTVVSKGTTHRDTWVKTPRGWKIKSVEELTQGRELIDGRAPTP
ncbi:MAG TPA: nuclear transport factor 2 family protein [Pyrinomonadaceae bacterium]